jgi:drug/metabolite transporter (DMT)-like permease
LTTFALVLVLVAAVAHASWNLLAKRAGDAGAAFVWLFGALSAVLYAPVAVWVVAAQRPPIEMVEVLFMVGSGALHLGYFVLLQRGYAAGDLSVVYPLARGTGPLLSTVAAVLLLGERPGALAVCGVALISAGAFAITLEPGAANRGRLRPGVIYGLLTGAFIAAYTIWDKQAVSALEIPPLLQSWATILVTTALLTPLALQRRETVAMLWRDHKREAFGVAVLSPLSYVLVLTALVVTPVSYVAPARETSILIGVLLGAGLLSEKNLGRRLLAAGAMALGVVALALG